MDLTDNLDPEDWEEFARYIAQYTEEEVRELSESIKGKVWKPVPESLKESLQQEQVPRQGTDLDQVIKAYREQIRPYRAGNTNPRYFGWVQGSGTMPAMMADIAISALNSNCGGRDHGAIYIERQVIDWCKQMLDFPSTCSGLMTSGTSASTQYALQIAMFKKLGIEHKRKGFFGVSSPLRCYASIEGHSSIIKAIQTSGIGSDNLVVVKTDEHNKIRIDELERLIKKDLELGYTPFMVIANAGTVNTGAFDDFESVRKLCDLYNCWMHVDGAFGAWMKIADEPYKHLTHGMELTDSLAFDFHKLMFVQYDSGALLVRDKKFHRKVFSIRPDYLAKHGQALAGGEPWYCDYGLELSRSFRALKVWFTLKTYGINQLAKAVTLNCKLATLLAEQIDLSPYLQRVSEPVSNILTFRLSIENDPAVHNPICERLVAELQLSGEVVFSLTFFEDYRVIRASITNHRTRPEDIKFSINCLNQLIEKNYVNTGL
jgi:glutamate/tyrosine decarboxylase-like PLP-dependent enzyme